MADDEAFELTWDGDDVLAALKGASMEGLELAAEHLLQVSSSRAPHEEGDLERSGEVSSDRGSGAVAVSYDRPYLGRPPARGHDPQARRRQDCQVPRRSDERGARHHAGDHREGQREAIPVD